MPIAQKKEAQQYFRANSLEFTTLFKRYHPGPYWILKNEKAFQLTPVQVRQETGLKDKMAMATIKADRALQQAYKTYALDAKNKNPAIKTLQRDITKVGKAETELAWEMVPYHLQGYQVLNAKQKDIYYKLAASTWAARTNNK
jgi:hypothetical protein